MFRSELQLLNSDTKIKEFNMKRSYKFFMIIVMGAFLFSGVGQSQTLQETLGKLTGTAGEAYVSPIISAFGSNLNSGWVHRCPSSKIFGVDLEVGFVMMGTMFGNNNKDFSTSGSFRFTQDQALSLINNSNDPKIAFLTNAQKNDLANKIAQQDFNVGISGPTIVGKKESEVMVNFEGATISYNSQNFKIDAQSLGTGAMGFLGDVSMLPLGAPQFSIGTVYGTSASFRFLPSVEIQDLGKFSYFGFGLQHNPSMFIPVPLPLDVSAAFFTQTLKVGDIFKASATTFGIYGSKTLGWGALSLTPYAGFSLESSSVDVAYDVQYATPVPGVTSTSRISFSAKGENSSRLTIGASLKLLLLNLSVDYSVAKYNAFSAGINFII